MLVMDSTNVLILSSLTNEVEVIRNALKDAGIPCKVLGDAKLLLKEMGDNTGAVIISRDALTTESQNELVEALQKQPKWSFLPVLMILSRSDLQNDEALHLLNPLPNLTVLEQPVLPRVLLSIVRAALAERKRQYELRDSLNEAIEANRAKSEFLANMSHEIRTPLGVILGFSDLIAEPGITDESRKSYLSIIQRNGQLLTAIVNDVLDLAKVEAGRLQIEMIETSIGELLSEVTSALKLRSSGKDLKLIVERDALVPDLVKTDPIRLRQILLNILGNAIKFTPKGTVKISVSTDNLSGGTEAKKRLVFRISDTGIGLKPEQASLLFQAFSQADGSITRRFGGTGLGLVLSQRLAQAMGGNVKLLESTYEVGSVFEVSIALNEAIKHSDQVVKFSYESKDTNLKSLRVLVVDDSKDNQMLVAHFLQQAGAKIEFADNGEEGVQKALNLNPDIILMDVQMPVLSGIDATIQLRNHSFTKPIVALTAHALKGDREQCLSAGFTDYITKPVSREKLLHLMGKLKKVLPNHQRKESDDVRVSLM